MSSLNHTHIYKRKRGSKTIFMCSDPHCTHTQNKANLTGKATICAICRVNETIMDYENLRRANPRCKSCSTSKKDQEISERTHILDSILFTTPKEENENANDLPVDRK